jgi:DNA-binding NtrC family response regulator
MRFPRIVVYETDGMLARALRPLAKESRWLLREPRRPESCLRALGNDGPVVVVLKIGGDLVRELELLEAISHQHPEARVVVVADDSNPALAMVAWDLGASDVVTPLTATRLLASVVTGFMSPARWSEVRDRSTETTG